MFPCYASRSSRTAFVEYYTSISHKYIWCIYMCTDTEVTRYKLYVTMISQLRCFVLSVIRTELCRTRWLGTVSTVPCRRNWESGRLDSWRTQGFKPRFIRVQGKELPPWCRSVWTLLEWPWWPERIVLWRWMPLGILYATSGWETGGWASFRRK